MGVGKANLVLRIFKLPRRIDEQDVAVGLDLVEDENRGADSGAEEQVRRQTDTASSRFSSISL
jgi:hypothetical protein